MKVNAFISFALALLAACSCSMKEPRGECPCWYTLKVESDVPMKVFFFDANTGECLSQAELSAEELSQGAHVSELPARSMVACGVDAFAAGRGTGGCHAAAGSQFPRVSAFSAEVPAAPGGEEVLVESVRCRQYATLWVSVDYADPAGPVVDKVVVRSLYDGFSLPRLESAEGEFFAELQPVSDGEWVAVIPRQGDGAGLALECWRNGVLVNTLMAGNILAEKGYDWTAPELADIFLRIHFDSLSMDASVDAWDESEQVLPLSPDVRP